MIVTRANFPTIARPALAQLGARRLLHHSEIYPAGELIRVHVPVPWPLLVPPRLCLLGVLWYHTAGEYLTPLGISANPVRIASGLNMSVADVMTVAWASDWRDRRLDAGGRAWRRVLESVVDSL